MKPTSLSTLAVAAALSFGAIVACSTTSRPIGELGPSDLIGPPQDASIEASADAMRCAANVCPAPFTTCPDSEFLCDVNLMSDGENCGACGVVCPNSDDIEASLHARWLCNGGSCTPSCRSGFADGNHDPRDGCEVNLLCDPKNCGGAGYACPEGVPCLQGICGCSGEFTLCGTAVCGDKTSDRCFDLTKSAGHCGDCHTDCGEIIPNPPLPPNMIMGCKESACTPLCEKPMADCNKDTATDGCEINLDNDSNNCGACGTVCAAPRRCLGGRCMCPEFDMPPEGECSCEASGRAFCSDLGGYKVCVPLDNNKDHCGSCNAACAPQEKCRYGRCVLDCPAGYANCNGDVSDGCEVRVDADPYNCGGCGIACDVTNGQPCIQGKCALAPCSEQVPR